MDNELKCGNCICFIGKKDKHNEEGNCHRNLPQVTPLPGRTALGAPSLTWVSTPHPAVSENDFCAEFSPRQDVVPDTEINPAKLEN